MAALVGVGMVTVLLLGEPEASVSRDTSVRDVGPGLLAARSLDRLAARHPDLGRRRGGLSVDFFARYGRLHHHSAAGEPVPRGRHHPRVMANPFYLDTGYSEAEIASVSKIFGLIMTLGGAGLGGVLVVRYGILRPLLAGAVLTAVTNLVFAWLATLDDPGMAALAVTVSADNLSGGMAGSAFIAYLSSLTNTAYTATQYALFSSLMTLPGKFIGGFSGWVVDQFGYGPFFSYTAIAGLPAVLLLIWLIRHDRARRDPDPMETSS